MSVVPAPLITGSIAYLVLAAVLIGLSFASLATGMQTKDNVGIANVVIIIATFAMWLFWLCAWLHQWHPLIKPIYED